MKNPFKSLGRKDWILAAIFGVFVLVTMNSVVIRGSCEESPCSRLSDSNEGIDYYFDTRTRGLTPTVQIAKDIFRVDPGFKIESSYPGYFALDTRDEKDEQKLKYAYLLYSGLLVLSFPIWFIIGLLFRIFSLHQNVWIRRFVKAVFIVVMICISLVYLHDLLNEMLGGGAKDRTLSFLFN